MKKEVLWSPSRERVDRSEMTRFTQFLEKKREKSFTSYPELHKFSVDNNEFFWEDLSEFYGIQFDQSPSRICGDSGFSSYSWFEGAQLNFAKNLLSQGQDQATALHFLHESGNEEKIDYQTLRSRVASFSNSLRAVMGKGDVLAAYMPNIPETVISMLSCTSFGGVFTSTSADFGIEGVVDRFGQSRPKVLVTVGAYQYNGKTYSLIPKLVEIEKRLDFLERIIVVDFIGQGSDLDLSKLSKATLWSDFAEDEAAKLEFTPLPFSHPLYIMYSSGTTGKPKCIVHSTGGTLIQHVKELGLHSGLTANKSIMYFTTCGWMMWNWLVSSLFFGARVVLYEGSPGFPALSDFFELIDRKEINIFGTSPKFLKALEDSGYKNASGLPSLESILSTGAPLLPEQFDFIYQSLKADVCVSSISGGTDIIGCFMLGNPNMPVIRGQIQCLGLGMAVKCFSDEAKEVQESEGELVCVKSFPSRPLYFLNDESGERIADAYFNRFSGVWHHGDFIKVTDEGGVVVYGRSDATLNPGGVRIGTAEIYRQTEKLSWIADSVCVGKKVDGDVEVALFIRCQEGEELDDSRKLEVKKLIKEQTTPRHVPRFIFKVKDIPYTRSGKKMELAVSRLVEGRSLSNIEAVANPDSLEEYKSFF